MPASDSSHSQPPSSEPERPASTHARDRILKAALVSVGESGYDKVSIWHLLDRCEVSRATFYRHFHDQDECFTKAFVGGSTWLCDRLRAAAATQPDWHLSIGVALAELLSICADQPAVARSILVEVHAANPDARRHRDLTLSTLAAQLDAARSDAAGERLALPLTAEFTVGALDSLVSARIIDGGIAKLAQLHEELLHFAILQYDGESVAASVIANSSFAEWQSRRESAIEDPPSRWMAEILLSGE